MRSNGRWSDLLDSWLDYTALSQSPRAFRLWSGISMIASALERRVWSKTGKFFTYPNLYIMLVANPGIGKQVIDEASRVLVATRRSQSTLPAFHIASDSITRASLIDELSKATQVLLAEGDDLPAESHHVMTIISEEFRVLMPHYDPDFVSRLDRLFNGPDFHRESRRTGPIREVKIDRPLLSLLTGAQPSYLADTFPENAWETGIGRRLLMIYSAIGTDISAFSDPGDLTSVEASIRYQLSHLSSLRGQMKWEVEAADLAYKFDIEIRQWRAGQLAEHDMSWPVPSHSRLRFYINSRTMMLVKLSTISAIAARAELVIRLSDVQRALSWLLEAEALMPDIFQEMRGKSDRETMEECHRFVLALWSKNRLGVEAAMIADFLSRRLPVEKVDRCFAMMERSDMIARLPDSTRWMPRPSQVHIKRGEE